jgi:16S rRNA (uracil1498-N3)-methyltransferase
MRAMRRVFHEELDGESAALDREESHHVSRVLRLGAGDTVEMFDGTGGTRQARVGETGKGVVEVVFCGPKSAKRPPAPAIALAVAPPKGQRMDTLVQMAQEIGLDEIIPIVTDNSVQEDFSGNRYARWRRVAIAAAKQSGASFLVNIRQAADFDELLGNSGEWDLRLVCHTGAGCEGLHGFLSGRGKPTRALVAIGPEGGFAEREVKAAKAAGFAVVSLPAATLRVETAAVFAASALCCEFEREFP